MSRIISYPIISTLSSDDLVIISDSLGASYPTKNVTLGDLQTFVNDGATLQRVISTGNTYQASPSDTLWTWGTGAITATSTSFTSLLSGKRFKTTFIDDGSYTDVLPNQLIFNNASGNKTSITPNTALSSNIDLQLPASSGILALTADILAFPFTFNTTTTTGIQSATNNANGDFSTAMGGVTTASGEYSTAMGKGTEASGEGSTAMGNQTTASGDHSTSMGEVTEASGDTSIAMGNQTTASGFASLAIGQYNVINNGDSANVYAATNTAFSIGNGTGNESRSNAFSVLFNGNVTAGSVIATSLEVERPDSGLILKSPDGTRYRITMANGGSLVITAV